MSLISQKHSSTTMANNMNDPINDSVKELERTFLFTDVPSCAMRFRNEDDTEKQPVADDDIAGQLTNFCGVLEKTFCFTNLEDINEEDIQRIKSMKSAEMAEKPQLEPADTESCSDDDNSGTPVNQVDVKSMGAEEQDGSVKRPDLTLAPEPLEHVIPPSNAHQASKKKLKNGKPLNEFQASRWAKKESKKAEKQKNKKRSGWGFFRKSDKAKATATKTPAMRQPQDDLASI
jgi:hypothetical protein